MNPFESIDVQESRRQSCFECNHALAGTDVRGGVPSTSTTSSADRVLMPVGFSDGHGSSVSGRSETDWDRGAASASASRDKHGVLGSRHDDGIRKSADPTPLAATGNFKVSMINDMVQVRKTGALPDHEQEKVFAAQNDIQSVQIGIHAADGSPLSNVNVSVSDLTGANGAKIDSRNIDLFREHYVNVTKSSNAWQHANPANPAGPTGWYADGLIPFVDPVTGKAGANPQAGLEGNHFNVAAGENQPIWADIQVPKGAAPGDYRATVTVDSNKGTVQVPLNLHVWNIEAPTKPGLTTSFNAIGKNDVAVQKVLLDNKVSPAVSDPSLEQQYLAEGLTSRNVGFYSGADYGNPHMGAPPGVAAIKSNKRAVNPTNDPNLELYDYSADEIGGHPELHPQIKQWAQNLHAAGVENLITMAPDPALLSDGTSSGKPAVDVFSMLPEQYDRTNPN